MPRARERCRRSIVRCNGRCGVTGGASGMRPARSTGYGGSPSTGPDRPTPRWSPAITSMSTGTADPQAEIPQPTSPNYPAEARSTTTTQRNSLASGRPRIPCRREYAARNRTGRVFHDVPVWCGGMLETGIGRAANVALAALPGFTMPGDTSASERYYATDLTEPFRLVNGRISVPQGHGLGVTPIPEVLERFTVRRAWHPLSA